MMKRVLLIDDDPTEHNIFTFALKEYDNRITCMSVNDCTSVAIIVNFHPDVIFLDVNMPRENGTECLRRIKSIPDLKDVPVYMYSIASYKSSYREVFQLGALKWLHKPASIDGYSKLFEEVIPA
jgi:CheY-like chemotaxis protein